MDTLSGCGHCFCGGSGFVVFVIVIVVVVVLVLVVYVLDVAIVTPIGKL